MTNSWDFGCDILLFYLCEIFVLLVRNYTNEWCHLFFIWWQQFFNLGIINFLDLNCCYSMAIHQKWQGIAWDDIEVKSDRLKTGEGKWWKGIKRSLVRSWVWTERIRREVTPKRGCPKTDGGVIMQRWNRHQGREKLLTQLEEEEKKWKWRDEDKL